jgi:predicted nuclease of predicted toxin-antitoxin system
VAELGLLSADDRDIFSLAREAGAIVVTKDSDFVLLQERLGSPPSIVWLTCGNVANRDLKSLIEKTWAGVRSLLAAGETLVEVSEVRRAKDSVG